MRCALHLDLKQKYISLVELLRRSALALRIEPGASRCRLDHFPTSPVLLCSSMAVCRLGNMMDFVK